MVSVIVPVYNVESYLPRCLDSIAAQTYTDIEVIMVDDGSTDSSGAICDGYCLKDPRFRVIHQENKWLPAARNKGLDEAKGEYVYFVDSDDSLHPRAIEALFWALRESGCEFAIGQYHRVAPEFKLSEMEDDTDFKMEVFPVTPLIRVVPVCVPERLMNNSCVAWNKLIPRELIGNERFPIFYGSEDFPLIVKLYLKVGKVAFLQNELYNYTKREDSIVNKPQPRTMYYNLRGLLLTMESLTGGDREIYLRKIYRRLLISRFFLRGSDYEDKLRDLRRQTVKQTYKEYLRSGIPFTERLGFMVMYFNPWIFTLVMKVLGY